MFKYVGVSRMPNGEMTVRYTNDPMRTKVLARGGHTDIHFIELLEPANKNDCVETLADYCQGAEDLDSEILDVVLEEAAALGVSLESY